MVNYNLEIIVQNIDELLSLLFISLPDKQLDLQVTSS